MVKNLPAMQETWVQSVGWEDPLEEVMATYSSVLAWRTPWAEEPGGLQSTESQQVGHDQTTKHTHIWNCDGACECVTELMMRAYDEAQGPLEVRHCTILGLVGSNQSMLCPWAMSFFFFLRLCPARFPPVSERQWQWRCSLQSVSTGAIHVTHTWTRTTEVIMTSLFQK